MRALFFDTETTGFGAAKLLQLGAILQDLDSSRIYSELNMLVRQEAGTTIPAEAMAVHGITDEMCATYGFPLPVVDKAFAFLADRADVLVAHNIQFDLGIMKANMPISWELTDQHKPNFCTMTNNTEIIRLPHKKWPGKFKWPNMAETHRFYFDRDFEGAHDAMVDIRACRDVLLAMIERKMVVMEDNGLKVVIQ